MRIDGRKDYMCENKIKKVIIFCIGVVVCFAIVKYFHIYERFLQAVDAVRTGQKTWETFLEVVKAIFSIIVAFAIPILGLVRLIAKDIMEQSEKKPRLNIRITNVTTIRKTIKRDLQEIVFGDKNKFIYADATIENTGECEIKTCMINDEKLKKDYFRTGDTYLFRFRITLNSQDELKDSYPVVLTYRIKKNIYYEEFMQLKVNGSQYTGECISKKKRRKRGRCD